MPMHSQKAILLEYYNSYDSENAAWHARLTALLPEYAIVPWRTDEPPPPAEHPLPPSWLAVHFAVVWSLPAAALARLPHLRAVLVKGAGVDGLGPLSPLPARVPVVRLIDPGALADMADYAAHWAEHAFHDMHLHAAAQRARAWAPRPRRDRAARAAFTVGILGLGRVGRAVADGLLARGFAVAAWSRSGRPYRPDAGLVSHPAAARDAFLARVDVLVNTLPSTPDSARLVDAAWLARLRPSAVFVNIGRAHTVDTAALRDALDKGSLAAAVLDVFHDEPLDPKSWEWGHPRVVVTPHIAGDCSADSAAGLVAENVRRVERGEDPFPMVDRSTGY